jgi:hypothetical protein
MPSPPIAALRAAALAGSCLTLIADLKEVSMKRKPASELLSKIVNVRVPYDEYHGFRKLAEYLKVSPGRLIRHILRENYMGQSDPLPDHMKGFREAVNQLAAAGRNLNQLARAANSGQRVDQTEAQAVMAEIQAALNRMGVEIKAYMSRRRKLECVEPRKAA